MRKRHKRGELDARKIIISFCTRSPQVLWAYIFKDVCVIGARLSRAKSFEAKKERGERRKEWKKQKEQWGRGDKQRVRR